MGSSKIRSIEGHYNFYGYPAYILKQKDGVYASGFFDPEDKVFKAGGSVKKISVGGCFCSLLLLVRDSCTLIILQPALLLFF